MRIRFFGDLFLYIVDFGIPAEMRSGDPDRLRRARIILSFAMVLIFLGLEAGAFFTWALSYDAAQRINIALAIAILMTVSVPVVFRFNGSLVLGANLVIGASYLVVFAVFTVIGGIHAPLLHWCALFPMLAVLMGTRTSAWLWAIIGVATIGFFVAADNSGWEFPDAVGFANIAGPTLWVQRFVDVGSWLGILFIVALLYEAHKEEQTNQLAKKNSQLESEVRQRRLAEQRSHHLAYYDELTTLPNRRFLMKKLDDAVQQATRSKYQVAVLFLDLDGFKEVNDLHGHVLGDQLLQQVGQRLTTCVRVVDTVSHDSKAEETGSVSRLGGDEFTIILLGIRGHREAAIVASRILKALEQPFALNSQTIFISTSIGIDIYTGSSKESQDLLRNADLAMYRAKTSGKNNFQFFEESMNTDIVKRSGMIEDVRKALDNKEFELYVQPIIDSHTLLVTGVEGLIRWPHPERGFIPPIEFIGVAEESGLILPLGDWVVFEACRQIQQWQSLGLTAPRFAINVSSVQFRGGAIVDTVRKALDEFSIDPGQLEIEVTEGVMMEDEDEAFRCLEELQDLGLKIALDDFGTGYSSLSYVQRFPVNTLKIDGSFVAEIESNHGSRTIVTAIIALAHKLGLMVVGECVENEAQGNFLRDSGCDKLQGYHFGRPIPADEFADILTQQASSDKTLSN